MWLSPYVTHCTTPPDRILLAYNLWRSTMPVPLSLPSMSLEAAMPQIPNRIYSLAVLQKIIRHQSANLFFIFVFSF